MEEEIRGKKGRKGKRREEEGRRGDIHNTSQVYT